MAVTADHPALDRRPIRLKRAARGSQSACERTTNRDRTRGERIPIHELVQNHTSRTTKCYGLGDRGVIVPGMKAGVNVIDFDKLRIHAPKIAYDLPAGGKRFLQRITGYHATICGGEVIYRHGVATGNLPGRLIRGPQAAPAAADANR